MSHDNPKEPNRYFVRDYTDIANEYYSLNYKVSLSEREAVRLGEILSSACYSGELSLLLNEIDQLVLQETELSDEHVAHRHDDQRARVSELTGYESIGAEIPAHRIVFEHASLNLMSYRPTLASYCELLRSPTLSEADQDKLSLILEEALQDGLLGLLLNIEDKAFVEELEMTAVTQSQCPKRYSQDRRFATAGAFSLSALLAVGTISSFLLVGLLASTRSPLLEGVLLSKSNRRSVSTYSEPKPSEVNKPPAVSQNSRFQDNPSSDSLAFSRVEKKSPFQLQNRSVSFVSSNSEWAYDDPSVQPAVESGNGPVAITHDLPIERRNNVDVDAIAPSQTKPAVTDVDASAPSQPTSYSVNDSDTLLTPDLLTPDPPTVDVRSQLRQLQQSIEPPLVANNADESINRGWVEMIARSSQEPEQPVSAEQPTEQSAEQSSEQPAEQSSEQPAEQSSAPTLSDLISTLPDTDESSDEPNDGDAELATQRMEPFEAATGVGSAINTEPIGLDDVYDSFPWGDHTATMVASRNLQPTGLMASTIVPFDGPSIANTDSEPEFDDQISHEDLKASVSLPLSDHLAFELGATESDRELNSDPIKVNNTNYIARLDLVPDDNIFHADITYTSLEQGTSGTIANALTGTLGIDLNTVNVSGHFTATDDENSGDVETYGGRITFADFLAPGNELSLYGGVQPVKTSDERPSNNPLLVEAYYAINVNEFFTLTPSVTYTDYSDANNEDNLYGAIRANFNF